jgi:hypothetical protein
MHSGCIERTALTSISCCTATSIASRTVLHGTLFTLGDSKQAHVLHCGFGKQAAGLHALCCDGVFFKSFAVASGQHVAGHADQAAQVNAAGLLSQLRHTHHGCSCTYGKC